MAVQDEELRELRDERGYGAADEDVNARTPDQVQQHHEPGAAEDDLTEDVEDAEEDGLGRGAD